MAQGTTREGREITGRMVLTGMLAFFGVVIVANGIMATLAVSTFGGVETRNAYQAGLSFKNEIAAARAQETRHWTVETQLASSGREFTIEIAPRDADGRPLAGYEVSVLLAHPASRRQDRRLSLTEAAPGRYRGVSDSPAGQWDLVIDIERNDERLFRSRSRVELK